MGLSKAEVGLQPTFSSAEEIVFAKGRMLAPFPPPKKGTHQQKKDTKTAVTSDKKTQEIQEIKQTAPKKTLIQKLEFPSHLFEQKNSSHPHGTPVKSNGAMMLMADPGRKLGKAAKTIDGPMGI